MTKLRQLWGALQATPTYAWLYGGIGRTQHFLHMVSGHEADHVTPGEATDPLPDAFTPPEALRAQFGETV